MTARAQIQLAVDNGPTDTAWQAMANQPERYAPLIRRLAGYYLMCGATENDCDFPQIGTAIELAMPGYAELTPDETYFVRAGAVVVICGYHPDVEIDGMAKMWMADGAPE
ncbi:hypothetical protein EN962_13980 [Mesorhizobium sp. M7A.F.Ca.CA.001.09.2.1]|uniref:Uncharacterized protein n=1 Tax=Mesorhizobium ciceri TaxID=39645 RepID=A0AB38T5M6_9HYPH|nr:MULTISPECIES: hypothetical protein [Mesorhizobium]RUY55475.1 hypothetical protein EN981_06705 [Mesorhizobium sp. M7A.F.Ca.CA.001.13.2.1]MDF3216273.1 hypothetical protein [Mesorhizobium ciceri]RUY62998.1 hypothetical protein EN965_23990 [Mesorhizobium sp. M7A.F.Ca.CA.001.05.1.1]RUY65223.1 hypothetical protein EN980_23285 [Mesorhizobium sp. M7A.F.Ca.CA.001.13.1.1]RUY78068.1 hypothetical protein EN962_13980 [Mesorhizobium sp. M7A.F.Ca.CA.001.09.2.1]